jgi:hypothetical protein
MKQEIILRLKLFFFFIFGILSFGYTQNVFTLIDSTNFEPVKFAGIAKLSTKIIVAFTNENGEFKINKFDTINNGYLIKCLGYKSKIITNLNNSIIYLMPVPTELNTVVVNDINYNTVFRECIEKLKANQDKKLFLNSFYNLYSENNDGVYEIIECFYANLAFPNKTDSLFLKNGRFAFFDSLANNKFFSSINLSNLVTKFNLLNETKNDYSLFPIIPFYDFNELKYVERKFVASNYDGTERVLEFLITPKEKYKRKIFTCSVFIGQKSFNLKKIILTITSPKKTMLNTINENSICLIDSISINILFNDFGTLNSYAEQLNFKINYMLRNGDETIPLNTTINLVNFETASSIIGFKQNINSTDRAQISNILYEPIIGKMYILI